MRAVDHYAVLGLQPDASDDEVKRAYRRLSRRYHPDSAGSSGAANTEEFIRITRAYHAIIDGEEPTVPARPTAPTRPSAPSAPPTSRNKRKRRLFGRRLPLRAVLGLALIAGILVVACLVISEVYSRRIMLSTLHDGGVAFVPPPTARRTPPEPTTLTFAEKMRLERAVNAAAAKKEKNGGNFASTSPTVAPTAPAVASSQFSPAESTEPSLPPSSRPTPAASSQPTPAALSEPTPAQSTEPSLPPSTRPTPAVISTAGRDLKPATENPLALENPPTLNNPQEPPKPQTAQSKPQLATKPIPQPSQPTPAVASRPTPAQSSSATQDFSLRVEMTAGEASRPSPYREQRTLSSRPTPAVISTAGRDLKPAMKSSPAQLADNPSPPTEPQLQHQLNRFLAAYTQAYGARNLFKFQQFFTANATENNTPITNLIPTYTKLFAATETLNLHITPQRWQQPTPGQITINGRFTIDLKYKNAAAVHGAGKIDFQLTRNDTSFHIEKMTYTFDQ
ncbi:J domain-containing protein [Desulfoprunum benzoelyticum]|nr:J domain-containing protein [Desulfoprunum benzoelyticum]